MLESTYVHDLLNPGLIGLHYTIKCLLPNPQSTSGMLYGMHAVVNSPSFETFKIRLGKFWKNMPDLFCLQNALMLT